MGRIFKISDLRHNLDGFTDSHFYGFTKGKLSDGWGVLTVCSKRPGEPPTELNTLKLVHTKYLCYDNRTGKIVERGKFESEGRIRETKEPNKYQAHR